MVNRPELPYSPDSFKFTPPTPEEMEEVQRELEEDWREWREAVRPLEKQPVTAEYLAKVLESDEFQVRVAETFGPPMTTVERILRVTLDKETTLVEKGFYVYKAYDTDEYIVTGIVEGKPDRISLSELELNRRDVFKLIRVHYEPGPPLQETIQGVRAPLIPSVIDRETGLSGDLNSLVSIRREDNIERVGVDVRPIEVVLRDVERRRLMILVQEQDVPHSPEQLLSLDDRLNHLEAKRATDQELQDLIRGAGYNLWITPVKEKYEKDDLESLRQFVFTPENIN